MATKAMRRSPRRRLPLTALRTFEAAARLQSFKEAAQELGVSATTVSNQIRMLEREWRCLLFVRKTRQVVLTETGQALGRVIGHSFDAIQREIDFHIATARHSVSMAVGSIFGARWLMPRLMKLRRDLPRIDLSLRRGRRITSPGDMPAAIVVDWGLGDWPGLEAEPLLRIRYAPVLSPTLTREGGALRAPRDLARLPALHQQDREEWVTWLALVGAGDVAFEHETIIEDSNVATQAAVAGQGVALGIFPFVQDDVDEGRLLKPFAQEMCPQRAYYIVTRPGARRRPEISAVCAWLRAEADAYAARFPFTRFTRDTATPMPRAMLAA